MPENKTKPSRAKRILLLYGLIIIVLACALDQMSKWLVLRHLTAHETNPILPFLDFRLEWNKGMSYGLLQNLPYAPLLLSLFALIVMGFFLSLLARAQNRLYASGLGLIIGGALGNVIDRALWGAVVDFISLHYQDNYWYVFNLGDAWITLGCVMVLYDGLFGHKK